MNAPDHRGETEDTLTRFLKYVEVHGADECWLWKGSTNQDGYGLFDLSGKTVRAHRYAASIWLHLDLFGPLHVMHRCDNPPCVNPFHLFIGTNADNIRDSVKKGRSASQKKTACKHGHTYTPETTEITKKGWRQCRTCRRANNLKFKARLRLA